MEKKSGLIKYCELCGTNATNLCFECLQYFCESCFNCIHEKKLMLKHKKENIDPYVPIDLKCPDHPKDRINLFCIDEKGKSYIYYVISLNNRIMLLNLLF